MKNQTMVVISPTLTLATFALAQDLGKPTSSRRILDATKFSAPLELGCLGPQEFISYYSYSVKGEFVHPGALAREKRPEAKYGDHV